MSESNLKEQEGEVDELDNKPELIGSIDSLTIELEFLHDKLEDIKKQPFTVELTLSSGRKVIKETASAKLYRETLKAYKKLKFDIDNHMYLYGDQSEDESDISKSREEDREMKLKILGVENDEVS